jgi:hypothetical protein
MLFLEVFCEPKNNLNEVFFLELVQLDFSIFEGVYN